MTHSYFHACSILNFNWIRSISSPGPLILDKTVDASELNISEFLPEEKNRKERKCGLEKKSRHSSFTLSFTFLQNTAPAKNPSKAIPNSPDVIDCNFTHVYPR